MTVNMLYFEIYYLVESQINDMFTEFQYFLYDLQLAFLKPVKSRKSILDFLQDLPQYQQCKKYLHNNNIDSKEQLKQQEKDFFFIEIYDDLVIEIEDFSKKYDIENYDSYKIAQSIYKDYIKNYWTNKINKGNVIPENEWEQDELYLSKFGFTNLLAEIQIKKVLFNKDLNNKIFLSLQICQLHNLQATSAFSCLETNNQVPENYYGEVSNNRFYEFQLQQDSLLLQVFFTKDYPIINEVLSYTGFLSNADYILSSGFLNKYPQDCFEKIYFDMMYSQISVLAEKPNCFINLSIEKQKQYVNHIYLMATSYISKIPDVQEILEQVESINQEGKNDKNTKQIQQILTIQQQNKENLEKLTLVLVKILKDALKWLFQIENNPKIQNLNNINTFNNYNFTLKLLNSAIYIKKFQDVNNTNCELTKYLFVILQQSIKMFLLYPDEILKHCHFFQYKQTIVNMILKFFNYDAEEKEIIASSYQIKYIKQLITTDLLEQILNSAKKGGQYLRISHFIFNQLHYICYVPSSVEITTFLLNGDENEKKDRKMIYLELYEIFNDNQMILFLKNFNLLKKIVMDQIEKIDFKQDQREISFINKTNLLKINDFQTRLFKIYIKQCAQNFMIWGKKAGFEEHLEIMRILKVDIYQEFFNLLQKLEENHNKQYSFYSKNLFLQENQIQFDDKNSQFTDFYIKLTNIYNKSYINIINQDIQIYLKKSLEFFVFFANHLETSLNKEQYENYIKFQIKLLTPFYDMQNLVKSDDTEIMEFINQVNITNVKVILDEDQECKNKCMEFNQQVEKLTIIRKICMDGIQNIEDLYIQFVDFIQKQDNVLEFTTIKSQSYGTYINNIIKLKTKLQPQDIELLLKLSQIEYYIFLFQRYHEAFDTIKIQEYYLIEKWDEQVEFLEKAHQITQKIQDLDIQNMETILKIKKNNIDYYQNKQKQNFVYKYLNFPFSIQQKNIRNIIQYSFVSDSKQNMFMNMLSKTFKVVGLIPRIYQCFLGISMVENYEKILKEKNQQLKEEEDQEYKKVLENDIKKLKKSQEFQELVSIQQQIGKNRYLDIICKQNCNKNIQNAINDIQNDIYYKNLLQLVFKCILELEIFFNKIQNAQNGKSQDHKIIDIGILNNFVMKKIEFITVFLTKTQFIYPEQIFPQQNFEEYTQQILLTYLKKGILPQIEKILIQQVLNNFLVQVKNNKSDNEEIHQQYILQQWEKNVKIQLKQIYLFQKYVVGTNQQEYEQITQNIATFYSQQCESELEEENVNYKDRLTISLLILNLYMDCVYELEMPVRSCFLHQLVTNYEYAWSQINKNQDKWKAKLLFQNYIFQYINLNFKFFLPDWDIESKELENTYIFKQFKKSEEQAQQNFQKELNLLKIRKIQDFDKINQDSSFKVRQACTLTMLLNLISRLIQENDNDILPEIDVGIQIIFCKDLDQLPMTIQYFRYMECIILHMQSEKVKNNERYILEYDPFRYYFIIVQNITEQLISKDKQQIENQEFQNKIYQYLQQLHISQQGSLRNYLQVQLNIIAYNEKLVQENKQLKVNKQKEVFQPINPFCMIQILGVYLYTFYQVPSQEKLEFMKEQIFPKLKNMQIQNFQKSKLYYSQQSKFQIEYCYVELKQLIFAFTYNLNPLFEELNALTHITGFFFDEFSQEYVLNKNILELKLDSFLYKKIKQNVQVFWYVFKKYVKITDEGKGFSKKLTLNIQKLKDFYYENSEIQSLVPENLKFCLDFLIQQYVKGLIEFLQEKDHIQQFQNQDSSQQKQYLYSFPISNQFLMELLGQYPTLINYVLQKQINLKEIVGEKKFNLQFFKNQDKEQISFLDFHLDTYAYSSSSKQFIKFLIGSNSNVNFYENQSYSQIFKDLLLNKIMEKLDNFKQQLQKNDNSNLYQKLDYCSLMNFTSFVSMTSFITLYGDFYSKLSSTLTRKEQKYIQIQKKIQKLIKKEKEMKKQQNKQEQPAKVGKFKAKKQSKKNQRRILIKKQQQQSDSDSSNFQKSDCDDTESNDFQDQENAIDITNNLIEKNNNDYEDIEDSSDVVDDSENEDSQEQNDEEEDDYTEGFTSDDEDDDDDKSVRNSEIDISYNSFKNNQEIENFNQNVYNIKQSESRYSSVQNSLPKQYLNKKVNQLQQVYQILFKMLHIYSDLSQQKEQNSWFLILQNCNFLDLITQIYKQIVTSKFSLKTGITFYHIFQQQLNFHLNQMISKNEFDQNDLQNQQQQFDNNNFKIYNNDKELTTFVCTNYKQETEIENQFVIDNQNQKEFNIYKFFDKNLFSNEQNNIFGIYLEDFKIQQQYFGKGYFEPNYGFSMLIKELISKDELVCYQNKKIEYINFIDCVGKDSQQSINFKDIYKFYNSEEQFYLKYLTNLPKAQFLIYQSLNSENILKVNEYQDYIKQIEEFKQKNIKKFEKSGFVEYFISLLQNNNFKKSKNSDQQLQQEVKLVKEESVNINQEDINEIYQESEKLLQQFSNKQINVPLQLSKKQKEKQNQIELQNQLLMEQIRDIQSEEEEQDEEQKDEGNIKIEVNNENQKNEKIQDNEENQENEEWDSCSSNENNEQNYQQQEKSSLLQQDMLKVQENIQQEDEEHIDIEDEQNYNQQEDEDQDQDEEDWDECSENEENIIEEKKKSKQNLEQIKEDEEDYEIPTEEDILGREIFDFTQLGFPVNSISKYKININKLLEAEDEDSKMMVILNGKEEYEKNIQLVKENKVFDFEQNGFPKNALELYNIEEHIFYELTEELQLEILEEKRKNLEIQDERQQDNVQKQEILKKRLQKLQIYQSTENICLQQLFDKNFVPQKEDLDKIWEQIRKLDKIDMNQVLRLMQDNFVQLLPDDLKKKYTDLMEKKSEELDKSFDNNSSMDDPILEILNSSSDEESSTSEEIEEWSSADEKDQISEKEFQEEEQKNDEFEEYDENQEENQQNSEKYNIPQFNNKSLSDKIRLKFNKDKFKKETLIKSNEQYSDNEEEQQLQELEQEKANMDSKNKNTSIKVEEDDYLIKKKRKSKKSEEEIKLEFDLVKEIKDNIDKEFYLSIPNVQEQDFKVLVKFFLFTMKNHHEEDENMEIIENNDQEEYFNNYKILEKENEGKKYLHLNCMSKLFYWMGLNPYNGLKIANILTQMLSLQKDSQFLGGFINQNIDYYVQNNIYHYGLEKQDRNKYPILQQKKSNLMIKQQIKGIQIQSVIILNKLIEDEANLPLYLQSVIQQNGFIDHNINNNQLQTQANKQVQFIDSSYQKVQKQDNHLFILIIQILKDNMSEWNQSDQETLLCFINNIISICIFENDIEQDRKNKIEGLNQQNQHYEKLYQKYVLKQQKKIAQNNYPQYQINIEDKVNLLIEDVCQILCEILIQQEVSLKNDDNILQLIWSIIYQNCYNFQKIFVNVMEKFCNKIMLNFGKQFEILENFKNQSIKQYFQDDTYNNQKPIYEQIKADNLKQYFADSYNLETQGGGFNFEIFHKLRHFISDIDVQFFSELQNKILKIEFSEQIKEFQKQQNEIDEQLDNEEDEILQRNLEIKQQQLTKNFAKILYKEQIKLKKENIKELREIFEKNKSVKNMFQTVLNFIEKLTDVFGTQSDFEENPSLTYIYQNYQYFLKSYIIFYSFLNPLEEDELLQENEQNNKDNNNIQQIIDDSEGKKQDFNEKLEDIIKDNNQQKIKQETENLPVLQKIQTKEDIKQEENSKQNNRNKNQEVTLKSIFEQLYTENTLTIISYLSNQKSDSTDHYNHFIRSTKNKQNLTFQMKIYFLRALAIQEAKKKNPNVYDDTNYIEINRDSVWSDTLQNLRKLSPSELVIRSIRIQFKDEDGIDYGGLKREWLSLLNKEIFNPDYGLFQLQNNKSTIQPSIYSSMIPNHLVHFQMIGRLIGKCLIDNLNLDIDFAKSFIKHILGKPLYLSDLEELDSDLYKNLKWIQDNDISNIDLGMKFSIDQQILGKDMQFQLDKDCKQQVLNEQNKKEYMKVYSQFKMVSSIEPQTIALIKGLEEIVPREALKMLSESELSLHLTGMPNIDLKDMKENTSYTGYEAQDSVIIWFWEIMEEFDEIDKANFLFFLTGSYKVPYGGFKNNQIKIEKTYCSSNSLPVAHTCFNQLDLPQYEMKQKLKEKLNLCIHEGKEGFHIG